jgi:hypothetical protein
VVARFDERGVRGFSDRRLAEDESIQSAAVALVYGIDPMEILDSDDDMRALVLGRVVEHASRLDAERRDGLAQAIANAVGTMLGGS